MATRVRLPTKFIATGGAELRFGIAEYVSETNLGKSLSQLVAEAAGDTWREIATYVYRIRLSGIPTVVQQKDGVSDSIDSSTRRMWTLTMKPESSGLASVLWLLSEMELPIQVAFFFWMGPADDDEDAAGGAPPITGYKELGAYFPNEFIYGQLVSPIYKKIGLKKIVVKGRGLPYPTFVPLWSQVQNF